MTSNPPQKGNTMSVSTIVPTEFAAMSTAFAHFALHHEATVTITAAGSSEITWRVDLSGVETLGAYTFALTTSGAVDVRTTRKDELTGEVERSRDILSVEQALALLGELGGDLYRFRSDNFPDA